MPAGRGVSSRHVLRQGPVLAALGRTVYVAVRQRLAPPGAAPALPGPEVRATREPLPRDLIDDYVAHVGGDPKSYRGLLPPHLFPQWAFPALARALEAAPYPLLRIVNGGCAVDVLGPIPDDEPIEVRARLAGVEDDGVRAILRQEVVSGTRSVPEALRCEVTAVVPLGTGAQAAERAPRALSPGGVPPAPPPGRDAVAVKKEKPRVPETAREIAREHLPVDAGLSFAKLTGDFNPIHWLAPAARASGFRNVILHGFGTFARAWEAVTRGVLSGDVRAISRFEARFGRPLVLPHDVGVYVLGREVFVGDAPGGPAYMHGRYEIRSTP